MVADSGFLIDFLRLLQQTMLKLASKVPSVGKCWPWPPFPATPKYLNLYEISPKPSFAYHATILLFFTKEKKKVETFYWKPSANTIVLIIVRWSWSSAHAIYV